MNKPTAKQKADKIRADSIKESGVNTGVEDTAPQRMVGGGATTPHSGPEKKPAQPPGRKEAVIRLDVYLQLKFKPDQAAGFNLWAKRNNLGARTMKQWDAQHEVFRSRPV